MTSRLALVWAYSMAARSTAFLVVVAISWVSPQLEAAGSAYILAFAANAFVAYVFNHVTETSAIGGSSKPKVPALIVILGSVLVGVTIVLSRGSAIEVCLVIGCTSLQAGIAANRARLVAAGEVLVPYGAPILRDLPMLMLAAATVWGELTPAGTFGTMALAVGVSIQALALWLRGRRREFEVSKGLSYQGIGFVLVGAIALAGMPLVLRAVVSNRGSRADLVSFEAIDRFGYVISIAVLGGIGTELQRRWAHSEGSTARAEMIVARWSLGFLGLAGGGLALVLGRYPLVLVLGRSELDQSAQYTLALVLTSAGFNLASIVQSRYLLARERYSMVAGSFSMGLVLSMLASIKLVEFGIVGVATASLSGNLAAFMCLVAGVWRSSTERGSCRLVTQRFGKG